MLITDRCAEKKRQFFLNLKVFFTYSVTHAKLFLSTIEINTFFILELSILRRMHVPTKLQIFERTNSSMPLLYCYCLTHHTRYRHITALLHKVTFIAVGTSFKKSSQVVKSTIFSK